MTLVLSGDSPSFSGTYQGGTITSGTAVTASGTAIDFTGIPSWVKRITVMLNGVSTNGSSLMQLQIGSGAIQTSGYLSMGSSVATGTSAVTGSTTGMLLEAGSVTSASIRQGVATISNMGSNIWAFSSILGTTVASFVSSGGGSVTLSGTLDRIRLTTVNGTDTFDAGSVNILYEG